MDKNVFTDREKEMMLKYLLTGAAAGSSLALGSSVRSFLKELKEQETDSSEDDDVIYVDVPKRAAEKKEAPGIMASGLGITGMVLGGAGGYYAVRQAYKKLRKKRLQEQLDNAQRAHLEALLLEGQEQGIDKFSSLDKQSNQEYGKGDFLHHMAATGLVSAPLLLMIASGVISNEVLKKTFPSAEAIKGKNRDFLTKPKKIIVRRAEDEEDIDGSYKDASYASKSRNEMLLDGAEMLIRTLQSNKKSASEDVADIIGAFATSRGDMFEDCLLESGLEVGMDMIKGAASDNPGGLVGDLALGQALRSSVAGPILQSLAAVEFNEISPFFSKVACTLTPHNTEVFIKIAGAIGAKYRQDKYLPLVGDIDNFDKEAFFQGMLESAVMEPVKGSIMSSNSEVEDNLHSEEGELSREGIAGDEEEDSEDIIDIILSAENAQEAIPEELPEEDELDDQEDESLEEEKTVLKSIL